LFAVASMRDGKLIELNQDTHPGRPESR
jgi:hypothetical protein